jgi:hypothetical protein
MREQMTAINPAWARKSVMKFVVDRFGDDDESVFLRSDIVEDCISQIAGFDELSEDDQEGISCLVFDAVHELYESNILLLGDVIFEINPDLPEILEGCATCTICRSVGVLQNTCGNS